MVRGREQLKDRHGLWCCGQIPPVPASCCPWQAALREIHHRRPGVWELWDSRAAALAVPAAETLKGLLHGQTAPNAQLKLPPWVPVWSWADADSCQRGMVLPRQATPTLRSTRDQPEALLCAGQVVEAYGCTLVEGVLSHQLKQFIIDGNKVVLNRPLPDLKAEDAQFEENEVYGIDILVSTGEGKARVTDERETTVRPLLSGSLWGHQMGCLPCTVTGGRGRPACPMSGEPLCARCVLVPHGVTLASTGFDCHALSPQGGQSPHD